MVVPKSTRSRPIACAKKPPKVLTGHPSDLSLDSLSGQALINALRGSCKGKTSLAAAREREHKWDERAWGQKRKVRAGETNP